nr:unnamed protein product [Digitaria exilis]
MPHVAPRKPATDEPASDAAAETRISSLGDDLLLEVFLRLPSLATLVRAALTCRAWRGAVASSPAFRRRFRAVHPPPLLGFFVEAPHDGHSPNVPASPPFVPTCTRDRDLAAAVRGGDCFLTSLHGGLQGSGGGGELSCWDIVDCSGGYVLLVNADEELFTVVNPLTRCNETASFDLCTNPDDSVVQLHPRLVCVDEDRISFLAVLLAHDESRVQARFFSLDTREWSMGPWVKVPEPVRSADHSNWIRDQGSMQANGFLYWVYDDRRHMVSLDTATMEISVFELPQCLLESYVKNVGETKGGATCIVYAEMLNVGVLMHTRDDDGVGGWVQDRAVTMATELERVLPGKFDEHSQMVVNNENIALEDA